MELTPQEVLELARKWQLDPVAEKQDLDKEDNKKISVLRKDELAKIQEITKLNVSQTDFNHAFGWIVAEGKILDFIEKEFRAKQTDPKILEEWAKEHDLKKQVVEKKKILWANKYGEVKENSTQKGVADTDASVTAAQVADQLIFDQLTEPPEQPTGGKREIPNVSSKTEVTPAKTSVQVGVGRNQITGKLGFFDYLRDPVRGFGDLAKFFKNSLTRTSEKQFGVRDGINQLSGLGKTNVLSRVGKVNVLSGVGKKAVAGTVAKTGFKAVLTKLGAFIPTGVTQAIAIVSTAKDILDKFVPKELQEKLKDLWSKLQIGAAGLAVWLLMNWGALIGGVVGGVIGASAGALIAPFLGPLAPLAPAVGASLGFTVGAFVGYSLQGIASSILGLGGGSTAGGVAAGAVPATISVGGFTLPTGLSAAASSFGALLSGSGLSTIALFGVGGGVGLVSLFTALTIITVSATQQQTQETTGKKVAFQVKNEVFPVSVSNYDGEEATLNYTITITVPTNQTTINSVVDKITRYSSAGVKEVYSKTENLTTNTVDKDHPLVINDSFKISGNNYKNSQLISVVTVTGEETETAVATVVLGQPPLAEQPFGYPADGIIKSLDDQPWHEAIVNGVSTQLAHCGTFLPFIDPNATKRPCLTGGLDIAGNGQVFSTLEGTVVYSTFDRGSKTSACDPATSATGFCYPGLGGVVYVQSKTGKFYVGFLHLAQDGRIASGSVKPGDPIGKIYSGAICGGSPSGDSCTSSGSHVHYQVLIKNGSGYVNYDFSSHFGSCSAGNLLPSVPIIGQSVFFGSFVCQ